MPGRLRVALPPPPHLWVDNMHLKTKKSSRHRPETATLEKPLILEPALLRKLDMTRLTRDRLLTIENLLSTPKKTKEKPDKSKSKRNEKADSWEDEDSSVLEDFKAKKSSRVINTTFRVRSHVRKGLREVFSPQVQQAPEKDGKKSPKPKEKNVKKNVEDVFGTLLESAVPSPCSTCGRSERPERLHAHPSVPRSKRSKLTEQRSSVNKPVAMKFRSGKSKEEKQPERPASENVKSPQKDVKEKKTVPLIRRETFKIERPSKLQSSLSLDKKSVSPLPSPVRKASLPVNPPPRRQGLPRTPDRAVSPVPTGLQVPPGPVNPPVLHSASPRRPRTITCYLCQKQFGTASYPLHEPQCLQKWHRENQALPAGQQQPAPRRPSEPLDQEQAWHQAWEAAQAVMVACERCSKTFLPHRLEAHQRVCPQGSPGKKLQPPHQAPKQVQAQECESDVDWPLEGPSSVHCHICGTVYSRAAIDHHERLCLKRWQQEHSRDSSSSAPHSSASSPASSAHSSPRRRLVLCYLCGRQFGSASITIHEPQCLRKWRQENERLPPAQRRPEPQRPDTVYDSEGQVDCEATEEAVWRCHLVQLVPCIKCGRTFNPDRVAVHQRCCKGPEKH